MNAGLVSRCLLLMLLSLAAGGEVLQPSAQGTIDWERRILIVSGESLPSAVGGPSGQLRVARADALRKLLDTVDDMVMTAESRVRDRALDPRVATLLRGACRNYRELGPPRSLPDRRMVLDVELELDADILHILLEDMAFQTSTPLPDPVPEEEPQVYSGLVVDARTLPLRPALAPRVLSEAGAEIYSHAWAEREWALARGLAAYRGDLEQALADSARVGTSPLLVKALRSSGSLASDLVIADDAARQLHACGENLRMLSQCRVIIVMDARRMAP